MANNDSDREATQEFVIRNLLVGHCGEKLTPDKIDQIVLELMNAIRAGSSRWAFAKE